MDDAGRTPLVMAGSTADGWCEPDGSACHVPGAASASRRRGIEVLTAERGEGDALDDRAGERPERVGVGVEVERG